MSKTKTSTQSPIRVDGLPSPFAGTVGLTLAPGKHQYSQEGFKWQRDLSQDLDRLVSVFDTKVLICLLEDDELERLKIPNLVPEAERRGLEVHRLPIPDRGVLPDLAPVEAIVKVIVDAAAAGKSVVIHCAGGLGRAGTVGGCFLVETGMSGDEAVQTLHERRSPRSPETKAQKRFISAYARTRRGAAMKAVKPEAAAIHQDPEPLGSMVAGAVLAAAIGDAMGHPTEFKSMDEIYQKYGPEGVQNFELFWQQDGKKFAPYTDDSQMAEAVTRGLLEAREEGLALDGTMDAIAKRFVQWSKNPQGGHRAPGNACMSGCRALASGTHWSNAGGPSAGGSGSVMRAYPFGLFFHADLDKAEAWAVAHSKLTHRDPIALAACAAMAIGVARLVRCDDVSKVVSEMVTAAARYSPKTADMMTRAVHEAQTGVGPEVTLARLQGWAAHEAIAAAVYIFVRHPDDPRAAILEGANTPGDSDSLATLAGALVGVRCGLSAVPKEWVEQVERSDELLNLARLIAGRSHQ